MGQIGAYKVGLRDYGDPHPETWALGSAGSEFASFAGPAAGPTRYFTGERIGAASPTLSIGKISAEENLEIDAAKIRARFLTRSGLLGTDARYALLAGTPLAIHGELSPPPFNPVTRQPALPYSSSFAPTPENTPGVYVPESEGVASVGTLTNILGGINQIASTVGGLATQYYQIRGVRAGPLAAPPPPAPSVAAPGGFAAPQATVTRAAAIRASAAAPPAVTPATPIFNTAGFINPFASGNKLVPLTAATIRTGGSMAGLGKIAAIAAALGIGVEVVSAVLDSDTHKHRRKRLLTKGDIADIGTMSSMLGKNSEAFRTWLAQSLRR